MYHRLLNIFIATEDHHLELLLRDIPPQKQFSHKFFLHRGFKFKVQHPVLGYWRLLKKLHRVS